MKNFSEADMADIAKEWEEKMNDSLPLGQPPKKKSLNLMPKPTRNKSNNFQ